MSMKENVDFVKQELSNEEKFLEGFVKIERFYKKNKKLILALLVLVVLAAIGYTVKQNIDEKNRLKANLAFDKILKNHDDKQALETLQQTNKKLYDVALYLKASHEGKDAKNINVPFLKQLAQYENALKNKNIPQLNTISMEKDFLLKEFAIFNKALLLANEGKYKEAKTALKLIPQTSKAYELATLLNHYLVTK